MVASTEPAEGESRTPRCLSASLRFLRGEVVLGVAAGDEDVGGADGCCVAEMELARLG